MESPPQLRSDYLPSIVGGMVTGLMLLGCGMMPLFDPAEAEHAETARELVQNLPSFIPSFNGAASPSTPPLSIWIQGLFFSLFGESELVARLPSALATGATAALIVRTGLTLLQPATAAFAGLAFGLCLQTQFCGRAATADAPALFFATAALHFAAQLANSAGTRRTLPFLMLSLSACFLTIGVRALATAIPITLLAVSIAYPRIRWQIATTTLASTIPALIWMRFTCAQSGVSLTDAISAQSPFQFAASSILDYLRALPFQSAVLLAGVLPFAHLLPDGFRALRSRTTSSDVARFFALSALVPLTVFTLSPVKHPAHVLPALPGLLLIAGLGADFRGMLSTSWFSLMKFTTVTLVLILFLAPIGIRRFSATYNAIPHLREIARTGSEAAICGEYQEPSLIWEIRKTTNAYPRRLAPNELAEWLKGPGVRFAVCTRDAAAVAGISAPSRVAEGISLRDGTRVQLGVLTASDLPR